MKNRSFLKWPLIGAATVGVAAWIFYPALMAIVAAPIDHTFVPRMPTETVFHRLQTSAAFCGMGFLVPFASIVTSRGRTGRSFSHRLAILAVICILVGALTTWIMHAQFVYLAGIISELEAKNPGIPVRSNYSMISLYRIAMYPSCIVLVVMAYSLFRASRNKRENNEDV
jgi:hypothetical protein